MTSIQDITPTAKTRVIDILSGLGLNVDAWSESAGGSARAATNPKYCYEWSYDDGKELIVVNLWTRQFQEVGSNVVWKRDIRDFTETGHPSQKARGRKLKAALLRAFDSGLRVNVIICVGDRRRDGSKSQVDARALDVESWAVTEYDPASYVFTLERGVDPPQGEPLAGIDIDAEIVGFEGEEKLRWYVKHRKREHRLRAEKIAHVLRHTGALLCEVKKCRFDFERAYGPIGQGFAHVHHLTTISSLSKRGEKVRLSDLAVVCANCHAMIHRNGKCRSLDAI